MERTDKEIAAPKSLPPVLVLPLDVPDGDRVRAMQAGYVVIATAKPQEVSVRMPKMIGTDNDLLYAAMVAILKADMVVMGTFTTAIANRWLEKEKRA